MRSQLSPDIPPDLEVVDLTFGSKNWDRRQTDHTTESVIACLTDAAFHLVIDQMAQNRVYWPGAMEAVSVLRKAIEDIKEEKVQEQRGARVAASWLPKYTLARQARLGDSDA